MAGHDRLRVSSMAVIVLILTLISGCGQPSLTHEEARLDNVVAAIPLYELAVSNRDQSQMTLIYTDGSYALLTGSSMFSLTAEWTEKGLFYQDSKKDYFIGADPSQTSIQNNPKTDFQYGSIALDAASVMTVYNTGLQDENDGQLQVLNSNGSHSDIADYSTSKYGGWGASLAVCGQTPYLISSENLSPDPLRNPSALLAKGSDGDNLQYQLIHEISFRKQDFPPSVGTIVGDEPYVYGFNLPATIPCHNNHLIFPAIAQQNSSIDEIVTIVLINWNVETGEYSVDTLKDSDGEPLTSKSGTGWSNIRPLDSGSLKGYDLLFFNENDGTILSTDVRTGVVHVVGKPKLIGKMNPYNGKIQVRTTPTRIYETVIPINTGAGTTSFIDIYDRQTEKLIKTLTINNAFTKYQQNNTVQPGTLAINPAEPLFNQ